MSPNCLKPCPRATAVLAALMLGACSAAMPEAPTLSLPDVKLPSLASAASSGGTEEPVGSATELYARIALGANSCWFAANGPLKKDYIYHAEADAPSRGGKAEIVVHVRDPSQANPRGVKAYLVHIVPKDETSATVSSDNLKMPEPMAEAMKADVERWSRGEQGCNGSSTAAGWNPGTPAADDAKASKTAKATRTSAKAKPKSTPAKP